MLPQEEGEMQVKHVMNLHAKDRERKTMNAHNASASGIGRQSPYSNVDGRPPMRPITPLKSSQTARVQHTHSVINSTQQNIDYYNVSGPIDQQQKQEMQAQFDAAAEEEEQNKNLPAELQSRPKIPRTPADAGRVGPSGPLKNRQQDIPAQSGTEVVPKIKGQAVTDEKEIQEFQEAFVTKGEKIPRTPPEEEVGTRRKQPHYPYP